MGQKNQIETKHSTTSSTYAKKQNIIYSSRLQRMLVLLPVNCRPNPNVAAAQSECCRRCLGLNRMSPMLPPPPVVVAQSERCRGLNAAAHTAALAISRLLRKTHIGNSPAWDFLSVFSLSHFLFDSLDFFVFFFFFSSINSFFSGLWEALLYNLKETILFFLLILRKQKC
jgi:hypothetical protein